MASHDQHSRHFHRFTPSWVFPNLSTLNRSAPPLLTLLGNPKKNSMVTPITSRSSPMELIHIGSTDVRIPIIARSSPVTDVVGSVHPLDVWRAARSPLAVTNWDINQNGEIVFESINTAF